MQHLSSTSSQFDDMEEIRMYLLCRIRWIEAKIELFSGEQGSEDKVRGLTTCLQKLLKSYFECVSLLRNPRLNISGESDEKQDLAKMIEAIREGRRSLGSD